MDRAKAQAQITITYCKPCGYQKRAAEVAAALRESLGLEPKLVAGKGGVFEVSIGGEVIAKRTKAGFPPAADIVSATSAYLNL